MPCNALRNLVIGWTGSRSPSVRQRTLRLPGDELCTPPNGQQIDPVRKVGSRSRTIDFQGVTNEYRHHPSYHSYPGFGGRVSNVGAQQELGIRTQRNRRGHCCHSDSPAPPREALNLTRQWARPDWSRGPVHPPSLCSLGDDLVLGRYLLPLPELVVDAPRKCCRTYRFR